jgi:hypothetical protein
MIGWNKMLLIYAKIVCKTFKSLMIKRIRCMNLCIVCWRQVNRRISYMVKLVAAVLKSSFFIEFIMWILCRNQCSFKQYYH